jgi:hypothetical protein
LPEYCPKKLNAMSTPEDDDVQKIENELRRVRGEKTAKLIQATSRASRSLRVRGRRIRPTVLPAYTKTLDMGGIGA